MKKPKSIYIFGDSTAWGAWDMEKGGWVNRLWFHVAKRDGDNYVEIYNCSVSGGTTETILERFENEAKIRGADALIFQTGGNDAAYENKPNNYLVSPEKFRENLEEIIKRAKKITNNIIFTDLKNCDESKTMPVSWIDIYYTNENIKKYSDIMKKVCQKNNVLFLYIGLLNNKDFDDGLHPNAIGHEKIFIQVRNFLEKYKWI
ncbi:MAG: Lysophospholipase L1 and related esterases family [Microgenomates group bacterium GW2011_GWC1_39_7]|nr:MAG: Lysophospholipase L1 and related esterases family [Microgenomates group bacterium GW2011_GWC1_39_7]